MSSDKLVPLDRAYRVDEAINNIENHIVIVRFGHGEDEDCKKIDEWLASEQNGLKNDRGVIYTVPINGVPELVARFNLPGDRPTILFFSDYMLLHRLSGDEINQEKFKGTVKMLAERKKAVVVAAPAVPPVHMEVDTGHQSAAQHKWLWWINKQ